MILVLSCIPSLNGLNFEEDGVQNKLVNLIIQPRRCNGCSELWSGALGSLLKRRTDPLHRVKFIKNRVWQLIGVN